MLNIYDYIANSKYYKIFKVNDLMMVEYNCMLPAGRAAFWTHNNYVAYILSGEAMYSANGKDYIFKKGEAMFVRRGVFVSEQHRQGEYCALIIFLPDDFIRDVADKHPFSPRTIRNNNVDTGADSIFSLPLDDSLFAYFLSMLSYFSKDIAPAPELLKLKFEELLLNILTNERSPSLVHCLRSLRGCGTISVRDVMEQSFMYPMSLEEYARLCARSLSKFKADFQAIYNTSPGKWLIRSRLHHAKILLETRNDSVADVAFASGFKNTTHFVKVFKAAYGIPPLQYRLKATQQLSQEEALSQV